MDISLDLTPASATYGDLLLSGGDLALTSDVDPHGANPILQSILQRLRMFQGEWFLNTTLGVPWIQQILVKNPNRATIDLLIQNTILTTPGVQLLTQYAATYTRATRVATISFRAQTIAGTVSYSGPLNEATALVTQ